jgi:hypothetical protein
VVCKGQVFKLEMSGGLSMIGSRCLSLRKRRYRRKEV